MHRFPNPPVRLPDGLHWNLLELFSQALDGARRAGDLRSVAVDSWGVDYALLDERDRVLGLPYHYRDTRTRGMAAVALARVRWEDLYAVTGTQQMAINTVFQLLAEEGSGTLDVRARARADPGPARTVVVGHSVQRGDGRVDDRPARCPDRHLVDAADRRTRPPTASVRRCDRTGHGARIAAPDARAAMRFGRRRRLARHRIGVRRSAGRGRARRRPLVRNVVAARDRVHRADPLGSCPRGESHQRARDRRNHPAAEERDGSVARAGVRTTLGDSASTSSHT